MTRTKLKSKLKSKTRTSPKSAARIVAKRVTKKVVRATAMTPAVAISPTPKETYQRFCDEVVNGGNFDLATQLLDPVVVTHNPLPGQPPGAAGFVEALMTMRAAFPDLRAVATHVVGEGDHVAARLQVTATHQGDFIGIPATGRQIQYEEFVVVRFAGGRIIEHWGVADGLAIMQQLGSDLRQ